MLKKIIFFLFFPYVIFSAPAGNPSNPSIVEEGFFISDEKWLNFRLGYETNNSYDLVMQFDDPAKEKDFYLRKIKTFSNTGIFTLNVKERLDLYVELGACRLESEFRSYRSLYNSKSNDDFLYRAGAKLVLCEIFDFTLSGDAKYSYFSSSSSFVTRNDKPLDESLKFSLKEWQISIGLGQKITILRPYIGVAYRDSRITIENNYFTQDLNLIFKKKTGLFLGSSASLGSFIMVNGEIRLVNERAFILSGEVRF